MIQKYLYRKAAKTVISKYKWFLLLLIPAFLIIMLVSLFLMLPLFVSQNGGSGAASWKVGAITQFGESEIPKKYIPIYKEAAKKYNVPWNLLAAIHRVETTFSTNLSVSSAGAIGHAQFMECSWLGWSYPACSGGLGNILVPPDVLKDPDMIAKHGGYGVDANGDGKADPMDIEDAIFTMASYLSENGAATGNIRGAVFAYNHSTQYVESVLGHANRYVKGYTAVSKLKGGTAWPVPGIHQITSLFGHRMDPITGESSYHGGLDISSPGSSDIGSKVVAFTDGKVITAGLVGGYGNTVIIRHGNGMRSLYGHLSSISVQQGEKVQAGQKVAEIGNSGRSTGAHLHFTVKIQGQSVDPLQYLKAFKYTMAN